jgi:hypothetical protein
MQYLRTFKGSPVLFLFKPSDSRSGMDGAALYQDGHCAPQATTK